MQDKVAAAVYEVMDPDPSEKRPIYLLKERRDPAIECSPRVKLVRVYLMSKEDFDALEKEIYNINERLVAVPDKINRKGRVLHFPTGSLLT